MIGNVVDAVVRDVDHLDPAPARRGDVNVVVSRPTTREHAYAVEPLDRFSREPGVVDEDGLDPSGGRENLVRIMACELA